MGDLRLPTRGLTFLHDARSANESAQKHSKQIILLNLPDGISNGILRSLRNDEQVRLKTGRRPMLQHGKKSVQLNSTSDSFPTDIFNGPIDGSRPLYFSGKLSLSLEVQRAKEDTARSDEALAALESTLKSMQEQRASNEASLVGEGKKQHNRSDSRSSTLMKERFFGSTPSSPYLAAGLSPHLAPTSMPLMPSMSAKDKIRLDAMRIPAVHLLAVKPMATDALAQSLNVSHEESEKIMDKISQDVPGGSKELKAKLYRELDVWNFPYKTQEDRELAIKHAIQAFDRSRLEKHDPLWQMLLPKEERGKGTILSKLNFDRQTAPPKPQTMEKEVKGEQSDREGKIKKVRQVPNKEPVVKKKQSSDGNAAKSKPVKATPRAAPRTAKQEPKIKSAERIEDSDEEAQSAPVIPAKERVKPGGIRPKSSSAERPPATASHDKIQPQKLESAGISTASTDRERPAVVKKSKGLESTAIKTSPRSLNGNPTQKRSPLGSSPPTNSTDLENSSKSSVQSSAPSSPPSSTDLSLTQRHNYSPALASVRTAGPPRKVIKRKAEGSESQPAAKRQQVNGERVNALPKGLNGHLQSALERRSSDSSLSSLEKLEVSKKTVVTAAKRFTTYYGQYRVLHEKLSHLPIKDRTDKDIDDLWRMHKRLEEMKTEIWSDWDKVSSGDA